MINLFSKAAVAAFSLIATAGFANAEPHKFVHDGVDYSYTTQMRGDEQLVIGTAYAGKVPFELYIRKSKVTGSFNSKPIDFKVGEVNVLAFNARRAKPDIN